MHPLQGRSAKRDREFEGLLARRDGAVKVSRVPEVIGDTGQHRPSRPDR